MAAKEEELSPGIGEGTLKEKKLEGDELRGGYSKFLCVTTGTMMFPYMLQRCWELDTWQATFLSWWCALTYAVSLLYWHDAKAGWRLDLDNFFAKLSFCVVSYLAAVYGQDFNSAAFGWPIAAFIVQLYLMSLHRFNNGKSTWIIPHGCMHICVGTNMGVCMWTMHRHLVSDAQMAVCSLGPVDELFTAVGALFRALGL